MQKIVFRNMNQDLTIVELKELGLDLHTENDLMISKASSQSHNMSFILNTQELGRLSMKSKGELKCRMLSYGTTELSDLRFKILSRDYQAWLKHQNPSNTLVSNSGVLSLTGGTFDDRSLKEGKFFAFSDFLKEGGEFALDVSAREGQGKVGFFLEDLHAETYALGSLSVAESDDSVWINPDEETVGIENKDGKPKVLKIKRVQQRAIIIYGDKLLGEIPLYTSIPTRVYITRLSGTFQLNSYRFKDRAVENSVDFMNFTWLKTNSRPLKFNFDFYSRLKSTTDWKGLYQHASEGNGNGFELEPDLPRRFILKLDSDYRSIKDLSFEQDFKLVGEGGEVSVKILQLEKGIEILLSIGGEIKFRKPYLSKIINFNLVMDGEKLGIYTNGYLIGEEMLLSEHPWTFQTEVTSTDPSYLKMSTLSWSEY
jgi:hypothetical protein